MNNSFPPDKERGFFKATAFTANRALPIENATVKIFEQGGALPLYTLTTDRIGETETVSLPAPTAQSSLSPDVKTPFSDYRAEVSKDGYYTLFVEHLPIFAGIYTTLPSGLIPKAAYQSNTVMPREEIFTVPDSPQALSEEVL